MIWIEDGLREPGQIRFTTTKRREIGLVRSEKINLLTQSDEKRAYGKPPLRLQADAIIDGVPQSLLATKVAFRRCHRNMAEQELF